MIEMEKIEIWKDIPGHEGSYQASTEGRIRSLDRTIHYVCPCSGKVCTRDLKGRILSPGQYGTSGHVFVILCPGTKHIPVHQIILKTFVGDPPEGMEVLHKNGDPTDNRLENLRYGTRRENIRDVYLQGGAWKKLSLEDVYAIRFGIWCGFGTTLLSKIYGVSRDMILAIEKRRSYSWA